MNILTRRIALTRKALAYPRFFMHMLYGGNNATSTQYSNSSQGLFLFNKRQFSMKNSDQYHWEETPYEEMDPAISQFTHKSNAQALISQVPVIEVDTDVVRCTGTSEFGFGHPVEYITLNTVDKSKPSV